MQNNDKYHFFIGNIFSEENQIRILKNIQKKLKKKYGLKNYHFNTQFFSNMIYLGYFNTYTANLYMDKIISFLLDKVSNKFNELNCNYTKYKLDYDKSFYKISLKFTDDNNDLEKIIIPYLHKEGILPIYERKINIEKPSIDLIYFKHSNILKDKKDIDKIKIQVPTDQFKIDHISLIKGVTTRVRSGTPSTHDQMDLSEVSRYNYPLKKI